MTYIQSTPEELRTWIEHISLPRRGGGPLFSPVELDFRNPEEGEPHINTSMRSEHGTGFLQGRIRPPQLKVQDKESATFDPEEFIDFLARFDAEETLGVTFHEDGRINISGATKTAEMYTQDVNLDPPQALPSIQDGTVMWRNGELESDTTVTVDTEDLREVTKDADLLDVADFPLHFEEGACHVSLGSTGAETESNSIETSLTSADVSGGPADTIIGESIAALARNVDGEIEIQTRSSDERNWAIAVRKATNDARFLYILSSRTQG